LREEREFLSSTGPKTVFRFLPTRARGREEGGSRYPRSRHVDLSSPKKASITALPISRTERTNTISLDVGEENQVQAISDRANKSRPPTSRLPQLNKRDISMTSLTAMAKGLDLCHGQINRVHQQQYADEEGKYLGLGRGEYDPLGYA